MAGTDSQATTREAGHEEVGIRRVNESFVRLVKRYLPDSYILAIILTAITFVMALTLTDRPLTSEFPRMLYTRRPVSGDGRSRKPAYRKTPPWQH